MNTRKKIDPIVLQWTDDAHKTWAQTPHSFLTGGSNYYLSAFFRNAIVRAQASAASAGL